MPGRSDQVLALRLRDLLVIYDVPQEKVAEAIGVSQPQICRYLSGENGIKFGLLAPIAAAIGCPARYLQVPTSPLPRHLRARLAQLRGRRLPAGSVMLSPVHASARDTDCDVGTSFAMPLLLPILAKRLGELLHEIRGR